MAELSHEEVVEILGGLGDVIIAEVIATGITKEELEAARARVIRDLNAQTPRDVAANFYLHTRLAEVDVALTAQLKAHRVLHDPVRSFRMATRSTPVRGDS